MAPNRSLPPVLAVDIGSSSVRAALYDFRGKRLPNTLARQVYVLETDLDGRAVLDPAELWRQTELCIESATKGWKNISAVGVSCFWHSLLGVDAKGDPLTAIYTWADSRCRGDAAELRQELSERDVHAETGCMLRASFWPAKLRWLQRTKRGVFRKVHKWLSPAEWIQWKLTGESRTALGMATGTGLFDPRESTWSERMLEVAGISGEDLPELSNTPTIWRGVPWFSAIGDGAAQNLGCDAGEEGTVAINFGTSAAIRQLREKGPVRAPFGLFCYRVDERRFLVGGAVSNAGNLHAWCLRELRLPEAPDELEKQLAARPAPEHGLTVLPFWNAERAPSWNEDALGAIRGLRQSTSAIDILQATSEASLIGLARVASLLKLHSSAKCVLSGGILRSESSIQRMANVLGRPVYASSEPEGSLRGAAIYALERLGVEPLRLKPEEPVRPERDIHKLYQTARRRQERWERLLRKPE